MQVRVALEYMHALADLHNELPGQRNFIDTTMVYCSHSRRNVIVTPHLEVVLSDLEGTERVPARSIEEPWECVPFARRF
jgi:hypothetical protein